ncbi:MAG: aldolase [Anaerolineae bacterium]|nr:aldolase [Anaerolineae bacterium]
MPNSIITPNLMKQALQNGQSVIGTMVAEIRQPSVMQLLKNAGFDVAIIDNEHGPFNIETIADLSRTARYVGLTPIVRVPDLAYPYIAQSLDAGAQGIMLPRVYTADQVRQAVEIMKYSPLGKRGSALSRGQTNFQAGPLADTLAAANQESLLIVQIETKEAVENIEDIVAIPGVDVALIGPTDLSVSLGIHGQLTSPDLHAAIETTMAACQRANVFPAIHINDLEQAAYWARKGMRFVSSSAEVGLLMRGGLEVTSAIRQAFD